MKVKVNPFHSRWRWKDKILLVMNLATVLLVITCLNASAYERYVQEGITLSEKNAKITEVFKKITQQTGYYFVHRDEWLAKAKSVDIEVVNASLQTVLDIVFKAQPLTYAIVGKTVIIKRKVESNKMSDPLLAEIEIRGKVTNQDGEPISGANITLKGTKKIVTTNHMERIYLP